MRLKLSQRYADRMEEHPNTRDEPEMKEVKATRRLKRKLLQDWAYALQNFINYQTYYWTLRKATACNNP